MLLISNTEHRRVCGCGIEDEAACRQARASPDPPQRSHAVAADHRNVGSSVKLKSLTPLTPIPRVLGYVFIVMQVGIVHQRPCLGNRSLDTGWGQVRGLRRPSPFSDET